MRPDRHYFLSYALRPRCEPGALPSCCGWTFGRYSVCDTRRGCYRFYSLRSTATATAAISSPSTGGCSFGVFQITVCFRTTCTLFPLPILRRERVPLAPPTRNGNFHSGYSRSTVNLRSARTLILPTYRLTAAIPSMAVSVMPIPAWLSEPTRGHSARSNHRAPFFTMLVSFSAASYEPESRDVVERAKSVSTKHCLTSLL